jgi:hypothetical protein
MVFCRRKNRVWTGERVTFVPGGVKSEVLSKYLVSAFGASLAIGMTAGSSFASTSHFTHTYSIKKASTLPAQLISDLTLR